MLLLLRVGRDVVCEAGPGFGRGEDVGTVEKLGISTTVLVRLYVIDGVLAVM